ncbi:Tubulin-specific chaperone C N-terminal [Trinorchestia longiramus]|nr:Tubulin-specific chaperone C N-terminal [Trinorchestia longiramus]
MNVITVDTTAPPAEGAEVGERLLSRMQERTQQREQRSQQRREQLTNRNAEQENDDAFLASFTEMKNKLEDDMKNADQLTTTDSQEIAGYFEKLTQDHGLIQQFLNESSMFLSLFVLKRSQETLAGLDSEIKSKMNELVPKKRFGFKGKTQRNPKPANTVTTTDVTDSAYESQRNDAFEKLLQKNFYGFKDRSGEELTLTAADIHNRQLNLTNLTDCTVTLLGNPGSIQAASLTNCTVIIGPTSRSAFIKNCRDCRFVLACQQVRIHDTNDSKFYLHVTGAAIIESCSNVGFAPYNLVYDNLDEHYVSSGLDRDKNNWNNVDDFKWLNSEEKSPNMYTISECERQSQWLVT